LDDVRVSKLSAKVFFKVNYSFKTSVIKCLLTCTMCYTV